MPSRSPHKHRLAASFVLGYHGCSKETAEKLLSGARFRQSRNSYDWLGHGIYFWEANPERALSYAIEAFKRKRVADEAAVVGAVIDLGYCLDLLSETNIDLIRQAYRSFSEIVRTAGEEMPRNHGGDDLLQRHLDCAVVNYLHASRREKRKTPFEAVRGLFLEGKPIFDGAGFREKTHVQICVRSHANIKGVFRVT